MASRKRQKKQSLIHHAEVDGLFEKISRERIRIVITDYILNECFTSVLRRENHATAVKAGGIILDSKALELIWLDEALKRKVWALHQLRSHERNESNEIPVI